MSEDHVSPAEPRAVEAAGDAVGQAPRRASFGRIVRRVILAVAALLATFMLFTLVAVGGAGWYTSRPQFCRSCHLMEPYYTSWQESSHRDVSCIECHFAPGLGGKARGKLLGLVQLAKYVTASEGPRPAAEIPDESCLRSGCHETRLLSGKVDFHGIPFDHEPHLGQMRREKQLRCTSCHSQIVQGVHMTVTASTCFLCHFKGEPFNEGLGACTRCHQIPDQQFDLGGGVTFSHELAYEKGVDCINCHGDVIRGKGEVPPERCRVCHNRPDDLSRIDDHVFLHKNHVTDHKIDCLECHLHIEHSLEPDKLQHAAGNCVTCHPNHHQEQVSMLEGVGGLTVDTPYPGMTLIRVECKTCHNNRVTVDDIGSVLVKGSVEACNTCHDAKDTSRLVAYHLALRQALPEIEPQLTRIREALEASSLEESDKTAISQGLDDCQHDVTFVREGNDIHNIHYASALIQKILERLRDYAAKLDVPPPDVKLPPSSLPGAE